MCGINQALRADSETALKPPKIATIMSEKDVYVEHKTIAKYYNKRHARDADHGVFLKLTTLSDGQCLREATQRTPGECSLRTFPCQNRSTRKTPLANKITVRAESIT
eukprot:3696575-Amphidinium_carterae.1